MAHRTDLGRRSRTRGADHFLLFVARPLRAVMLADVQAFADELERLGLAPSSRARALAAVKSLLAWGQRSGYLPLNVGAAVRLPHVKDTLAERILDPLQVQELVAREPRQRNQVLLLLIYAAGLRASEVCGLRWRDLQARDDAGQVTDRLRQGRQNTRGAAAAVRVAEARSAVSAMESARPVLLHWRGVARCQGPSAGVFIRSSARIA